MRTRLLGITIGSCCCAGPFFARDAADASFAAARLHVDSCSSIAAYEPVIPHPPSQVYNGGNPMPPPPMLLPRMPPPGCCCRGWFAEYAESVSLMDSLVAEFEGKVDAAKLGGGEKSVRLCLRKPAMACSRRVPCLLSQFSGCPPAPKQSSPNCGTLSGLRSILSRSSA